MAEVRLQDLVDAGLARAVVGDPGTRVGGVRHDSRAVEAGDLFFAIRGQVFDGADYSGDAVARGAAAVASEVELDLAVPVLLVDDALAGLWRVSQHLYGDPTKSLPTVGVTGTNGKTTVTFLIEQLLLRLGERPAVIGTVSVRGPGGERPASHTTPMADDLMRHARWALDTGASQLIVEVSSHALAMARTDGVHFAVAAFTNLTQDHLDYHGTMEAYAATKARLFGELSPRVSVFNVDDPEGERLAHIHAGHKLTCSKRADSGADLRVVTWDSSRAGLSARIATPAGEVLLHSPLLGAHNLENLLVALGCALGLGFAADRAAAALSQATGAPGRLERIEHPDDVLVFVDYAHTPDALARVCAALRAVTTGRLLVVFGCGGDRDRAKRPRMGQAVGEAADIAFATSDNPRSEAPAAIIEEIIPGLVAAGLRPVSDASPVSGTFAALADRSAAIAAANAAARPGDTVLIAGKGHETYQIIGAERLSFDDRQEARAAIAAHARAAGESS